MMQVGSPRVQIQDVNIPNKNLAVYEKDFDRITF
jgi:hypothetical protein